MGLGVRTPGDSVSEVPGTWQGLRECTSLLARLSWSSFSLPSVSVSSPFSHFHDPRPGRSALVLQICPLGRGMWEDPRLSTQGQEGRGLGWNSLQGLPPQKRQARASWNSRRALGVTRSIWTTGPLRELDSGLTTEVPG